MRMFWLCFDQKPAPGLSDFADFIALASPLAPPLAVPGVSLRITSAKGEGGEGETGGAAGDGEEDMDKKENSVLVEEDDGGDNEGDDDPDPEAKQDTQTKPSQAVTEWCVMYCSSTAIYCKAVQVYAFTVFQLVGG